MDTVLLVIDRFFFIGILFRFLCLLSFLLSFGVLDRVLADIMSFSGTSDVIPASIFPYVHTVFTTAPVVWFVVIPLCEVGWCAIIPNKIVLCCSIRESNPVDMVSYEDIFEFLHLFCTVDGW